MIGLYTAPPGHAVVISIDEKSQIQALHRMRPGLAVKRGRAGTATHDFIRNVTITLFAALDVLDGSLIGQCVARHRHHEFLRFLSRIEAEVPADKLVHVGLDNLQAAIDRYLAEHNTDPKPLAWTTDPDSIIAAASRGYRRSAFDPQHPGRCGRPENGAAVVTPRERRYPTCEGWSDWASPIVVEPASDVDG